VLAQGQSAPNSPEVSGRLLRQPQAKALPIVLRPRDHPRQDATISHIVSGSPILRREWSAPSRSPTPSKSAHDFPLARPPQVFPPRCLIRHLHRSVVGWARYPLRDVPSPHAYPQAQARVAKAAEPARVSKTITSSKASRRRPLAYVCVWGGVLSAERPKSAGPGREGVGIYTGPHQVRYGRFKDDASESALRI